MYTTTSTGHSFLHSHPAPLSQSRALPAYPYKGRAEPAETSKEKHPIIEYYPSLQRPSTLRPRPGMVAPRSATLPPRYPRKVGGGTLTGTGQHFPPSGKLKHIGGSSGNLIQQTQSTSNSLSTNGTGSTGGSKSSLLYSNTSQRGSKGYLPIQLPSEEGAPFMRSSKNNRPHYQGSNSR